MPELPPATPWSIRRSKCSPALVQRVARSKEDLVLSAFSEFVTGRQLSSTMMASALDEGFFASILKAEASDPIQRRRNFSLETLLAAGHSDTMRPLILGELLQGVSERTVLVEVEDEQNQRFDYAVRTVVAVVLSVGWLATVTPHTDSLDMAAFAEPFAVDSKTNGFQTLADVPSNVISNAQKREGVAMTIQDKAKNAVLKASGSLDRAIGTIFADEHLEAELSISRRERPTDSVTRPAARTKNAYDRKSRPA